MTLTKEHIANSTSDHLEHYSTLSIGTVESLLEIIKGTMEEAKMCCSAELENSVGGRKMNEAGEICLPSVI